MKLDRAILQILDEEEIGDQQSFLVRLGEMGFSVTQSTLSRHLRKLGVRKQNGVYSLVDPAPQDNINTNLALEVVTAPPNALIIKTLPGHANAVAYHFESKDFRGVAGTVAGNDTLMVALSEMDQLETVRAEIIKLFKIEEDRK